MTAVIVIAYILALVGTLIFNYGAHPENTNHHAK